MEILPGGRAFRFGGRTHPIPGTFSIPRGQVEGVPVTNRDTVEHAVGVTLVMAGVHYAVPPDQCSSNDSGPRRVFIVR